MGVRFGFFSRSRSGRRWLVELLLLLALALLATQQLRSEPTLTPQESLWSALLQQSSSLPQLIDDYAASWMQQVNALQDSNASLTASVGLLQTSNSELTQQNAGLLTSLEASQMALATSESALAQLRTSLDDSLLSITQAKTEAEKVARELAFWRGCGIIAGILAASLGVAVILK